jgi:hypothetical protein
MSATNRDGRARRYESDSESDQPRSRTTRNDARRHNDGPRSILVDPTKSGQRRSNSRARFQPSSDSSDGERRRGPRASAVRRDLERKDSEENQKFREKRDGYLSDEGEALKKAKQEVGQRGLLPVPRGNGGGRGNGSGRSNSEAPIPPPLRGGYGERDRGGRRARDYDTEPDDRGARRGGRDRDDGYGRDKRPAARYGSGNYDEESPRRRPPPRDDQDRDRDRRRANDVDRGYRSDHIPGRRTRDGDNRRPGRYEDDDRNARRPGHRDDDYDRPQRGYYSDRDDRDRRERDRNGGGRYDDDRKYRNDKGRRPRYDDDRDYKGSSNSRRKGESGSRNWQKEASALFVTYALPVIQKEGTRFVKKQAASFLAKRAGAA